MLTAINTMTSFIHNEPTSLAILQEANIPQTLLSSLSKEIPASTDVVTSIPGAFGAICLNASGLDMMTKEFPMKKLFDIFTSIPHVRAFQESDINSNIGVSMDELVRHQPTLKPSVMKEIGTMLNAVLQKCAPEEVSADEMVFCTLQKTRAADAPAPGESNEEDESKDDRKDSLVAQLIEGAARVNIILSANIVLSSYATLLTTAPSNCSLSYSSARVSSKILLMHETF